MTKEKKCPECGGVLGIGSNVGEWFDKDCPTCTRHRNEIKQRGSD